MNLFNKKILNQRIANFSFPKGEDAEDISKLITGWQKALKDSDLSKTKEKSIQGKFLNVFFEQILGYEDKTGGLEEWSLIAEPKTEVDAQTADGSIGFFTKEKKKTIGVIELKDAKTSLDKKQKGRDKGYTPVEQGYLYATKFDRCKWIIVSNFREIRLYNKARSEQFYEKFDVLDLHNEDEFKKFYFLLHKENLLAKEGDSPIDDLAKKSTDQEEDISKKFYTDYKAVRSALFDHLAKKNKDIDKKVLFEKSQKILDRIVFILFCEDTANLLPKNVLRDTYDLGKRSRDRSDEKIWREMKNLFIDIDEGRDDIDPKINGYNGGLFKFDEVLDNLHIKDDIWEEVINLSDYDFETDLNVNILGHIFEQSISDIESLKAEIEGEEQDRSKSERKKDGIFYTPEYITKYIVENTVGKYLEEHPDKLEEIKILDPACGSGAFLNQAHSYLVNEYKVRHEQKIIEKEKKGEAITLFDYNPAEANRAILLNNLYGVDLNDESVEISKLSLWLKTARKDEPLQNLDNNIKVGNSLIDDPEVAGKKAFNWKKEFPEIMGKKPKNGGPARRSDSEGGFDVIIGNPPYVYSRNSKFNKNEKIYYKDKYNLITHRINTFFLFIEKSYSLLNNDGILGFIIPNNWLTVASFYSLRDFILDHTGDVKIVNFNNSVFEDASVDTCIVFFKKGGNKEVEICDYLDWNEIKTYGKYDSNFFDLTNRIINVDLVRNKHNVDLLKTFTKRAIKLNDIAEIKHGVVAYLVGDGKPEQTKEIRDTRAYHSPEKKDKTWLKYLHGSDVSRYSFFWGKEYIKYGKNLARRSQLEYFQSPRLLIKQIPSPPPYSINSVYVEDEYVNDINSEIIMADKTTLKFLLGVLNSKPFSYWFKIFFNKFSRKIFPQIKLQEMKNFLIPKASEQEQCLIGAKAMKIQELEIDHQRNLQNYKELLKSEYNFDLLPNIMKNFINTGWNEFMEEFEKQRIKCSLDQKEELQKWFNKKQNEMSSIQSHIDNLNNEIDQEVYKLYGLTKKEIDVIEGAI